MSAAAVNCHLSSAICHNTSRRLSPHGMCLCLDLYNNIGLRGYCFGYLVDTCLLGPVGSHNGHRHCFAFAFSICFYSCFYFCFYFLLLPLLLLRFLCLHCFLGLSHVLEDGVHVEMALRSLGEDRRTKNEIHIGVFLLYFLWCLCCASLAVVAANGTLWPWIACMGILLDVGRIGHSLLYSRLGDCIMSSVTCRTRTRRTCRTRRTGQPGR